MNRKREAVFVGIGVLAGFVLSDPAAQAAASITATLSTQPIYVDGQQMWFEAYHIHGNNFVKLRDIGQAVDFGVTYDAATNSVYIDSTQPYWEETSTVPSAPTEESVRATLAQLRETYPTGTVYPTPYRSTNGGPYHRGTHCSGWATLCSDAVFGDLPWRRINRPNWEQLRPGDLVEYQNSESYHVVVVISKADEYVKVTESGTNNHVRWGGRTSSGGWRSSLGIRCTHAIRNRRSQAKAGDVPHEAPSLCFLYPVPSVHQVCLSCG